MHVVVSLGKLNLAVNNVAVLSGGHVALIRKVNYSLYGDNSSMVGNILKGV